MDNIHDNFQNYKSESLPMTEDGGMRLLKENNPHKWEIDL
jgi:hypothetical protein